MFWLSIGLLVIVFCIFLFLIAIGSMEKEAVPFFLGVVGIICLVIGSLILYSTSLGWPAIDSSVENYYVYRVEAMSQKIYENNGERSESVDVVLSGPEEKWRLFSIPRKQAGSLSVGGYYFATKGSLEMWEFKPFVPDEK